MAQKQKKNARKNARKNYKINMKKFINIHKNQHFQKNKYHLKKFKLWKNKFIFHIWRKIFKFDILMN